jgi:glycerol-3-phosphate dehydrogenase
VQTEVLIIGGGVTGTGIARDLSLRGINCILVEKEDINHGASGANHGLLHSGGRYVSNDPTASIECREEGEILRRVAPHCIEDTGGLFIAVEGDDEKYIADFPSYCSKCGIRTTRLDVGEAREMEPAISEKTIAVYSVNDASIDPFKLSLENIGHAQKLGAGLMRKTGVAGFEKNGRKLTTAILYNSKTGEEVRIAAEQVVNAAGPWAGEVAAMAGAHIDMLYSKGTLLITNNRVTERVCNRLRPPANGDILVPGFSVSVIGTTSVRIDSLDVIRPTVEETDDIIEECAIMAPVLLKTRFIRGYSGVRPLVGKPTGDGGRSASRGFTILEHHEDGLDNLVTITGGKLTTYRMMAEKISDIVCERLGVTEPCTTMTEPLPPSVESDWTEPGLSPKQWLRSHKKDDLMICDCEMVSRSAIDTIVESIKNNNEHPGLTDIGLRSRVGRGSCQGSFCGSRTVSYLYDNNELHSESGIDELLEFYNGRWKGIHTILWNEQMVQAELMEAINCGLFSLETYAAEDDNKGSK